MDFIKMIMELPGEKRSQDVVEHTEWNSLWKLIVTQGNHSENYLEQLYDYFFNKEGWVHKVQAELDGVQPYIEGVMTQPVGKAPDGSLWTYPSTESGTVPWGNVMGDITKQQDLIQKLNTKADTEHRHGINTLTFNEGDIDSSWIRYSSQSVPTSALEDLSVTTEKLNNGAVTTAKIASGAIINDSIANGSVSNAKIADNTIARAKLAQDALYSPIISLGSNQTIDASYCGKTLRVSKGADAEIDITLVYDTSIPYSMEFAVLNIWTKKTRIVAGTNAKILLSDGSAPSSVIVPSYGMAAAKLITRNTSTPFDQWYITGNVEVV